MRPFARSVLLATLLFTTALPLAVAQTQIDSREGIALQNQIYQLRQELKALEDQAARGGGRPQGYTAPQPPPPQYSGDIVAQLLTRVDSLEDQVRQLRGRVEQLENGLQQQNADLGKRIDDLAFQVNPQGSAPGIPAPPPGSAPPKPGPAPTVLNPPQGAPAQPVTPPARPSGPRTPELTLQEGNTALARHDYPAAEAAAREVLANRTSPRAYDAQLLLAQALSGEHQYAQAAIAFDDAYNRGRKGTHAQDALIGLAGSLNAINEKKAACDTLSRLHAEFPQPRPDVRDSAAMIGQRAGCH
jgi:TolA-binding protein